MRSETGLDVSRLVECAGTYRVVRGVVGGPGSTVRVVLDENAVNTLISVDAVAVDGRGVAAWPS